MDTNICFMLLKSIKSTDLQSSSYRLNLVGRRGRRPLQSVIPKCLSTGNILDAQECLLGHSDAYYITPRSATLILEKLELV